MQRQFNESNQQKSIKIQHAPTCKIAHLAEHRYFHPGSNRATSKKVCTIFSLSGWHLPETMKRGKRGPEGKRACRRHDMLQDFCKLRQRKSKGIHCETHHQQPWHSVSRNGPVCHTDWLWNGGNLGAPFRIHHVTIIHTHTHPHILQPPLGKCGLFYSTQPLRRNRSHESLYNEWLPSPPLHVRHARAIGHSNSLLEAKICPIISKPTWHEAIISVVKVKVTYSFSISWHGCQRDDVQLWQFWHYYVVLACTHVLAGYQTMCTSPDFELIGTVQ